MNSESKRPITIEDLLRVKRAERPPAEFWTEFDRALRAKQLAALVAKRPWWQSMPRIFAGFSRYHIPLGATAVLTVAFISVRNYESAPSQVAKLSVSSGSRAVMAEVPSPAAVAQQGEEANDLTGRVAVDRKANEVSSVAENTLATAVVDSTATTTPGFSVMIPLLGTAGGLATISAGDSTQYRSLTVANDDAPGLAHGLLLPVRSFENRAQPARAAIEPLQQITPPSERSRAKLLTAMLSMTSSDTYARPAERAASKLSEERLYDQSHRFGARGAGLNMKF